VWNILWITLAGEANYLVTDAGEVWRTCSEKLRAQLPDSVWRTWFTDIRAGGLDESVLVLSAPNQTVRDRIEARYLDQLEAVVAEIIGPRNVQLVVRALNASPGPYIHTMEVLEPPAPAHGGRSAPTHQTGADSQGVLRPVEAALNARYKFDAFVIGASNRFAHAAAQRVAETPALAYNPLFIHGDSGLGKTHLLHAIGHYVMENFPQNTVRYVSTETFMNDFVDAIRNNSQPSFKRRYRDCDVLLVDDIQFMEGKEGLQEEFFYTFNTLHEGGKQLVLSSDRHPRNIATLEHRLRSRFESGLITDVQPPELETRLAILRKKAEGERTQIPDDVLELIATHVRDNIRELEGALIRVSAFASLNRELLTRQMAEMVLSDIMDANRPRQVTPKLILETTSAMFGYSIDDLCGPSRRRPLVTARQISMYVFRDLTDFSYPAIAREFGGRDHTTVIHAVEKITQQLRENRQVYDQVTELIMRIKGNT
jgi:chromosomal replication initiator protein